MSGNSKNGWNEEDARHRGFGNLLERVNTQLTRNPGSSHYHSGFMPAATPPWPHHPTTFPQHSPHVMSMDPNLTGGTLGPHVELNSLRSYSVSQDPFPDMEGVRTPLLRSSSDLGIRLSFQDIPLDGIMRDHPVESLDGTVFYPDNAGIPLQTTTTNQHLSNSKHSEIMGNQTMHYGAYLSEPDSPSSLDEQSSKFSTKLSNFTASLGTWLSPLDQLRTNYCSNSGEIGEDSRNNNIIHENLADHSHATIAEIPLSQNLPPVSQKDVKPHVTKPSYSDVLSKAPSQEGKTPSSSQNMNRAVSFQGNAPFSKKRDLQHRSSNNKCSNKNKNNNSVNLRSNSPNTNVSCGSSNSESNSSGKLCSKFDTTFSKVGLDEFDLPENVSNCTSYSNYLINLNNTSKSCMDNTEKTNKKRPSIPSEESSPGHQPKKGSKNESKRLPEKKEESPNSSDIEKHHCDKLNNHTLTTQHKQTPKKPACINNNLTSLPASIDTPSKTNNTDNSSNVLHRKSTFNNEDSKLQFDNVGGNVAGSKLSSLNYSQSGNNFGSASIPNPSGNASSTRTGTSGSRSNRGNYNNKADRKDAQSKKNNYKRKKGASVYCHSDLLMTGWTMCLLWMEMAARAGLWLIYLVIDVIQMSSRLFIHFSLKFWETGKLQWYSAKVSAYDYWLKLLNYFSQRRDSKKGGRSDRKSPSGLEHNIPLPTTGEEAMKRLLACRGKDPYSILGVTRECTDDDIKKYYKRQAFLVHPDKNKQPGAEEAFKILAHAFEIIGEPERRQQYDTKLAEEVHFEGASGELASLLNLLKEKLEEAVNTIRCTNCNKRHRRVKLDRPIYAARCCAECQIRHAAREGDIWAESWYMGIRWKYFACMEGAIYDISEWAACQRENLKHLQANTHSVQYRIVSGKKNAGGKNASPECPTDPELEEFFNNLCRERFGQDFMPGTNQTGGTQQNSDARKRKGKRKK